MKLILFYLSVIFLITGCNKDNQTSLGPPQQFKVSFVPGISSVTSSGWQQVLGGIASLNFNARNSDTLTTSSLNDTINLKIINSYRKQLSAGKYDITLKTESTAPADTFIRFNAKVEAFYVKSDGAISLSATTGDGVITINKSLIEPGSRPKFLPSGSVTALNFGLANGYYFIYVKGTESGKITFTEATTGDEFMKNVTVTAMTRHNLLPTLNSKASFIFNHNQFSLKSDF